MEGTYEHEQKSSTTAKTALGLSIGALGAMLLGSGGGGLLAGLLGRPASATVTPELIPLIISLVPMLTARGYSCNSDALAALEAENAKLKAERYADKVGIETFRESAAALEKSESRFAELIKDLNREAVDNRVANARMEERLICLEQRLTAKIEAGDKELANAIMVESERRLNGDRQIEAWTNCNFVQYKRVIDSSMLCPPVQLASGGASNAQPTNVVVSGTVTTQAASA